MLRDLHRGQRFKFDVAAVRDMAVVGAPAGAPANGARSRTFMGS